MGFFETVGELCGVPCHRVRVYRTQRILFGHAIATLVTVPQMLSFRFGRASASKTFRPAEQVAFQISHVEPVMRVFQIR